MLFIVNETDYAFLQVPPAPPPHTISNQNFSLLTILIGSNFLDHTYERRKNTPNQAIKSLLLFRLKKAIEPLIKKIHRSHRGSQLATIPKTLQCHRFNPPPHQPRPTGYLTVLSE